MKKKIIFLVIVVMLIVIFFLQGRYNAKIEFHKIEQFTKMRHDSLGFSEVYVIVNPPKNLETFKKEILKFNLKNGKNNKYKIQNRLFIKEHYPTFLEKYFWCEKTEYLANPPAEINNIDFLCDVHWYKQMNGRDTVEYNYYTGKLWFYKEE